MSRFQILIVAFCFILNFNDGIDIMLVSFSGPEIIAEWGLGKAQMGYIFSAALAGMTLGCFLLAPLADKIGRRKTFIFSLVLESIGMLGIAVCDGFGLMLCLRFLTGLGVGGLLPTMAATTAEFSNTKYRDFNVGLIQAGWPIGAIFTGFFCAWSILIYGRRSAFLIAGIISLLMLILVYFFMTDSVEFLLRKGGPDTLERINALRRKMNQPQFSALPEREFRVTNPGVKDLFSSGYQSSTVKSRIVVFFGFMTLYTLLSWVPTIAKESGLPFAMAVYAGVALNIGAAIGSASVGALGTRLGLRQTILTFMMVAFVAMCLYAQTTLPLWPMLVIIFVIGVFVQGGFNGIWPLLTRLYPAEIRTTGIGFALGIGRFGAILGPVLFGVLADMHVAVATLFILFSIPLLFMGVAIWGIRPNRLKLVNS